MPKVLWIDGSLSTNGLILCAAVLDLERNLWSARFAHSLMGWMQEYPMLKAPSPAGLLAVIPVLPVAADTIRVRMSGAYFPFTFVQQDKLQGFEVDRRNALTERTSDTVEFSPLSFSGLIGALQAGRIDTVADQITSTPDRKA